MQEEGRRQSRWGFGPACRALKLEDVVHPSAVEASLSARGTHRSEKKKPSTHTANGTSQPAATHSRQRKRPWASVSSSTTRPA